MKSLITFLGVVAICIDLNAQPPAIDWQKCYGGSNSDVALDIKQTLDGGYIIVGYTLSNDGDVTGSTGSFDYWVVKTDLSGAIKWQKAWTDTTGYSVIMSVSQTKDSGYILGGSFISAPGYHDYIVIKLNAQGVTKWQRNMGRSSGAYLQSIQQTTDGGYIAGGSAGWGPDFPDNHGQSDYGVLKLNDTGGIEWQHSYGGTRSDHLYRIRQTLDEGYIMAGHTYSFNGDVVGNHGKVDCWIIKTDRLGIIQWRKSYGGAEIDMANDIKQTRDGGYIIAGSTASNDGDVSGNHSNDPDFPDAWVVKINDTGAIQWQKCLGGTVVEEAVSVNQTPDGGYLVAGHATSRDGDVSGYHGLPHNFDYWVLKLDTSGSLLWEKAFGGSSQENAVAACPTTDGGIIVAGSTTSNDGDVGGYHGDEDFWIVKLKGTPTSVVSVPQVPQISICPNPTSGSVIVETDEPGTLSLINIQSQQVARFPLDAGNSTVVIPSEVSHGVYLARFVGSRSGLTRIIKITYRP